MSTEKTKLETVVRSVNGSEDWEAVKTVRQIVFVDEQKVSAEDEFDEFENTCRHFAAEQGGTICGAARWRYTEKGIKLERFAVLKDFRGTGVGSALVAAVLEDIAKLPESAGKKMYLHGQLTAVPLYTKFGFRTVGDIFDECGIDHYLMEKYA